MTSATERLARLLCQKEDWERAARFLDRLQDLAPENPAIAELRPRLDAHRGIGAPGPAEAAPAAVPTLDELDKVVVLESDLDEDAGEDEVEGMEALGEAEAGPATAEAAETPETGDEEDQDAAYAGKSVIQEMRGQPVKEEVDEDFISEHFTEAEVFLKYGLEEKAREQLQTILGRYPEHIPSLQKVKEIHSEDGNKSEVAAVCRKIAEIHRSRGEEEQAREMEGQLRELDSAAVSEETAEIPEISDEPASSDAGFAGAAASLDSDLDLDLPDLSGEPEKELPVPAGRGLRAPLSAAPVPAMATEEVEEDLIIELVDEEMEGKEEEEAAEAFDPDKASQFDFYLEQRLVEEAEEVLSAMERSAPGHPEVVKRRARLADFGTTDAVEPPEDRGGDLDMDVERAFGKARVVEEEPASSQEEAPPAPDEGFFDLGAELKAQVLDGPGESAGADPAAGISGGEEASIDEIFKAFRRKVDQQVEEEDYDTRYNLGIAYKEMGLLDEAIGEFQYASRDPKLFLECCSILGICFKEKGMTDLAIKWYRKALESTGHSEDKYQGLRYDLGDLYIEKGDYGQALAFFSEVYGINSNYRDVASRIRELRKRIG
jgi:tetratricopeptide (TPR) repeat protein